MFARQILSYILYPCSYLVYLFPRKGQGDKKQLLAAEKTLQERKQNKTRNKNTGNRLKRAIFNNLKNSFQYLERGLAVALFKLMRASGGQQLFTPVITVMLAPPAVHRADQLSYMKQSRPLVTFSDF